MPTKAKSAPGRGSDNAASGTAPRGPALSARQLLEQDHRDVEAFFAEYGERDGRDGKEELALKICLALQVHARIEEEIFYPAARDAIENKGLIDEAVVEHGLAKQLVAEIEAMEIGDTMLDAKIKVLGEQVRHHIEEEEGELFPAVEATDLDLDALGQQLADRKAELFQQVAQGADPI